MDDLLGLELQLLMPQCTSRGRKGKLERRSQQEATRSGNDNAAAATKQNIQIQAPVPGEFRRASSTQRRLLFAGTSTLGCPHVTNVFVPFYYYKYLEVADMQHLSPAQIQSLEQEDCLKIPSGSVLDEFMRQYFLYIHPCLPVLDEGHFWALYSNSGNTRKDSTGFSLALFQAMLFAASRFVPITLINACGFDNLKHARAAFHRRAELLLSHELECDNIALAQTSLLLSLHSTMKDQSLNSIWLAKAISHAKHAGANNYYCALSSADACRMKRKRLWWCCILRDRMIALGVRRNVQIAPDNFDFDQHGLNEAEFAGEIDASEVYDSRTKRLLVRIVVAQCMLAVAMTPTMTAAYQQPHCGSEDPLTISALVSSMGEVERARTELMIWARRFKSDLTSHLGENQLQETARSSVSLFGDMTLIHFYSTQVALYNHQASVLKRYEAQLDDYESRIRVLNIELRIAIANVTEKIKGLSEQGLAHCLPISAPSCSALPLILETLDLRLSSAAQRLAHQQQLSHYNKIMTLFRFQHDHTECVTTAINNLLQVADTEIQHLLMCQNELRRTRDQGSSPADRALYPPSNWSDVFADNQMIYLRLSLTLDLSLSRGKIPHVTDLPIWALGSPATLQAPLMSLSLHLMSPAMQPMEIPTIPRSEEVGAVDNDADALFQAMPATEHMANVDFIMPWPVANVTIPSYGNIQQLEYDWQWSDMP